MQYALFFNTFLFFFSDSLLYILSAYDIKNKRNIALKTENNKAPFPLTIYESNVSLILNGFGKLPLFYF